MNLEMNPNDKGLARELLASCGGAYGPMMKAVELLDRDKSDDFFEAFGVLATSLDGLMDLAATARQTSGKIDQRSLLLHFSGTGHTGKFDTIETTIGAELPRQVQAFAHTLVPLSMVGGKYYYDNGDANVELRGLVPYGKQVGTPYAHLAALIWVEDGGMSAQILGNQLSAGLPNKMAGIDVIDYFQAPRLRHGTEKAKEALGL